MGVYLRIYIGRQRAIRWKAEEEEEEEVLWLQWKLRSMIIDYVTYNIIVHLLFVVGRSCM